MSFQKTAVVAAISIGAGYYLGNRNRTSSLQQNNIQSQNDDTSPSSQVFAPFVFPPAVHAFWGKSKSEDVPDSNVISIPPSSEDTKFSKVGQLVRYGIPATDSLRTYQGFMLSYDRRNRTANWVLEHLTPESVTKTDGVERKNKFVEDQSFHAFHRATNKDYAGSGYDRGHLAAAANHRNSESAMDATFVLSNISPQVGVGFNRDAWNNLEKYVRGIARNNKNTYVCTGPLYLPRKEEDGKLYIKFEVIGQNHVSVPTHFFKIVVTENQKGQLELLSWVMPNQPLPEQKVNNFLVPLNVIERAAGLNFFQGIPAGTFKRINAINS